MHEILELLTRQLSQDVGSLPTRLRRGSSAVRRLERCVNVDDLRALAQRRIPKAVFDFVDGAAADEITATRNRNDFGSMSLHPRALNDVSNIELSTSVLGQAVGVPLLGAPTGLSGLVHWSGEVALARAVHAVGSIYVLSAMASYTIEEVSEAAPGPKWFQLYLWRDRGLVRQLIERARASGYQALVLTIDTPRAGARERDVRNDFGIPPRVTSRMLADALRRPQWSLDFMARPRFQLANVADGARSATTLTEYISRQFDPSLSWAEVDRVRQLWDGRLVLKGILRPEDAHQAVAVGADAVIVSNHGGRQLDSAPSTIDALPRVVQAVGGGAEVLLDGGVRRGTDVVKALARGARACLVGRPLLYGLAAGGRAGAERAMRLLVDEIELTMTLLGHPSVGGLDARCLGDEMAFVRPSLT